MDRWKLIERNEYLCIICNNGFIKKTIGEGLYMCNNCHSTFRDIQDPSCSEMKEICDKKVKPYKELQKEKEYQDMMKDNAKQYNGTLGEWS